MLPLHKGGRREGLQAPPKSGGEEKRGGAKGGEAVVTCLELWTLIHIFKDDSFQTSRRLASQKFQRFSIDSKLRRSEADMGKNFVLTSAPI